MRLRLEDAPDVLSREQVMEIFKYGSRDALYEAVQRGAVPPPDLTRPMRWFRPRLETWWREGVRVKASKLRRVS